MNLPLAVQVTLHCVVLRQVRVSLWVYLVPNRFAQLVALGRKARALNKHSKHSRDTILRWKWVCISLRLVPATVHENRGFSVPIPCACEGESPSTSGLLGVVPVSAPTIEGKKRKSILVQWRDPRSVLVPTMSSLRP